MTSTEAHAALNQMSDTDRDALRTRLQAVVDHLVGREAAWNDLMAELDR